jgi:hypothetical protein
MHEVVSNMAPDKEEKQAPEDIVSLSSNEERERKLFMGDINKFMAEIGKPLSKIPIMGYKELDLFQLFREVTAYGGFIEVVKNVGTWSKIWKRLGNFDPSITDSSFRLKKNYERYLLDYEYKMFPEHRQQALDMEKAIQMKKTLHNERPRSPPTNENTPQQSRKSLKSSDGAKGKAKKAKRTPKNPPAGYKELARDQAGAPKLPLNLGELTVESLGTIIPQTPYITDKHIWPIGFRSSRYFSSMINPELRVKYTCQIIDGGDKPQFVVTAEDEPKNSITSYSPSGAWKTILKKVYNKNGEEAKKNASVSGALRFGLAHPMVSQLIRELPNADKCNVTGDYSSSPSSSPSLGRKRRSSDEEVSDSDDDYEEETTKRQKLGTYDLDSVATNSLFTSKKELEDLESAVATLQALKYCAVF